MLVCIPLTAMLGLGYTAYVVFRLVHGIGDPCVLLVLATVPLTAVSRISGRYFCFVAEQGPNGLVARQRPIEVGELLGNDYVVRSGLQAGDRIITNGIQKLADGAPVKPE